MGNDPRGSIWRRWDLHVHTPSSEEDYLDKSVTDKQLVEGLLKAGLSVVAITDHHFMDKTRIANLQTLGGELLTIFPGIELRSELGGSESVHFTGIFPTDCNLDKVWTTLMVELKLSKDDVTQKGGHKSVYVDFKESAKLIHDLGGLVSVHAGKKTNSIENISNAEMFKQAVKLDLAREAIDIFEIGSPKDIESYREIVFKSIEREFPLIICSDNHRISEYKTKVPCWIKADRTFAGLRRILAEPIERVYLGDLPPDVQRVNDNKTKYIQSVSISKKAGSTLPEEWFNCKVPLNHGLVAVIGNKGSGKSALADTIGLLGNSTHSEAFSFLRSDKFRNARNNKAKHFDAVLTWASEDAVTKNLDEDVEEGAVETVRYIPQNYLETICNELKEPRDSQFDHELKAVIFSHVDDAARLGQESLDGLIHFRTVETEKAIDVLKKEMHEVNQQVVLLEERSTQAYRKAIENQLGQKTRELEVHNQSKPSPVPKPEEHSGTHEETQKRIDSLKANISQLDGEIKTDVEKRKICVKKASTAERLIAKLGAFVTQYKAFESEAAADLLDLGIESDKILKVQVDSEPLVALRDQFNSEAAGLAALLDESNTEGPSYKRAQKQKELENLNKQLDEPSRRYQAYLKALEEWQAKWAAIVGGEDIAGSVTYLKAQLVQLDKVPTELSHARERRMFLVRRIFVVIKSLRDIYKELYGPVQDFVNKDATASGCFKLDFRVSIVDTGFVDYFFEYVTHNRRGSFCGVEEGTKVTKSILGKALFDSEDGVATFLTEIMHCLETDTRPGGGLAMQVADQLKKDVPLIDFYDFLFSLGYLRPRYTMQWSGKDLDQLAPGERGTLLLVFYLLVDRSDMPLIIDQPEENLDNETVYRTLVPCIRETKKRRQIIIVTHNPNLAVVCDADQIIHASIDKTQLNRVSYASGAIESPQINTKIVDILEGTMPAFDGRERAYSIVQPK